jgi:hypothetical protein
MRPRRSQRDAIDVCSNNQLSPASPGDPGKHPRACTHVEYRFRLSLSTQPVHR